MYAEITLYSTGCPRCKVVKNKLYEKKIPFTENNSVEDMLALGITAVPVIIVNNNGEKAVMEFKEAVEWVNNFGEIKT